ncbi:DUF1963 domain-containing protein [Salmonella enterica subsp. enterica]|nr:DUF1963 domain-containing protein [Salmonella enterica subsp. enterica]
MFASKGEIVQSLCEVGVDATEAVMLAQQARPAVELRVHPVADESTIPIGATKIGGRPDLPAGMEWRWRGPYPAECMDHLRQCIADPEKTWFWAEPEQRVEFLEDSKRALFAAESSFPLPFVAQINFAEMWAVGELDADMPHEGMLYLFYDVRQQPGGFNPQENVGFSVCYHPSITTLTRRELPEQLISLKGMSRGRVFSCEARWHVSPLPYETQQWECLGLSEEAVEAVCDWQEESDDASGYQIGGWPNVIQGDMQVECALVSAGYDCGHSDAYKKPELAAVRATATEWLLLAQIDSDDHENGWMWGDSGRLYVWIKRDDLKARRFELAQVILQCY